MPNTIIKTQFDIPHNITHNMISLITKPYNIKFKQLTKPNQTLLPNPIFEFSSNSKSTLLSFIHKYINPTYEL